MSHYLTPSGLDLPSVLSELRSGPRGFVILPGLFDPEEVGLAKAAVMWLVATEGRKATHFQVNFWKGLEDKITRTL